LILDGREKHVSLPFEPLHFIARITDLHTRLRERVMERMAGKLPPYTPMGVRSGDLSYAIDEPAEDVVLEFCAEWGREARFILVSEGLEGGTRTFPDGCDPADAQFVMIVDPIDGTRGLMYDKRSAWILTGIAPNRGPETNLRDIQVAVQTELPTTRQYLAATLHASTGTGASGEMHNVLTGEVSRFAVQPSTTTTIAHGFATISKFFPGGKILAAEIEERLIETVLGTPADGVPLVFDDQYISTGGQLYELCVGHDLFTADLRPAVHDIIAAGPLERRLCAHPYDLCAELIAREAGVLVCDPAGERLAAPLDTETDIAWMGFANQTIRDQVYPVLRTILEEMGWEPEGR
jgi:fructose-1,6-bisphosphatase/inositol monophosphatase family enzyme